MQKRLLLSIMIVMALIVTPACVIVTPADRLMIDMHRDNAVEISERVAQDETLPDWVKTWWTAEAETWNSMSSWAAGEESE